MSPGAKERQAGSWPAHSKPGREVEMREEPSSPPCSPRLLLAEEIPLVVVLPSGISVPFSSARQTPVGIITLPKSANYIQLVPSRMSLPTGNTQLSTGNHLPSTWGCNQAAFETTPCPQPQSLQNRPVPCADYSCLGIGQWQQELNVVSPF